MAISLKNALKAYDRMDIADIDCGNGWVCQIHSFASISKQFAKEQARIRAKGGIRKKATTNSAIYVQPDGTLTATAENPYVLGSYEADVDFFVGYMLVGWSGLKDDDGNDVPYARETAKTLFMDNGKPAEQLLRELWLASLDGANFVGAVNTQAEEDGKN